MAVNANSRDFLKDLGIWKDLKSNFESIDKIVIKDYVNKNDLIFRMPKKVWEVLYLISHSYQFQENILIKNKLLLTNIDFDSFNFKPKKMFSIHSKNFICNKIIFLLVKIIQIMKN